MTTPVIPPAAPAVPVYPALGSPNFNQEAYTYGSSMPAVSAGIGAIGDAAYTNAVAANERAVAADSSAAAATAQADAAMGYRNTAQSAATTATTKAAEADASAIAASKLNLGDKASPPTTDNQGGTLRAGATYYDTTLQQWRVWTGSDWGAGLSINLPNEIHSAAEKTTPADLDELGIIDSAAGFSLKKLTFAALKTWLAGLFVSKSGATMTGPLSVPAGASGAQVPQAQEIPSLVRAMAVGTVSQAGGMPTGAVIEWGSNANGLYVRFADGTQICAQSGTFAGATEMVWTYPAVFASDPNYLSASVNYPSAPRYYTADAATTGGNISATIYRSVREARAPVADGFPMCVIAIGRWF